MTRREQIAKALREAHFETESQAPHAEWEDLPHERKRKWLALAAVAEREVAAANEHEWIKVERVKAEDAGRTVRVDAGDGSVLVGRLREVGLGYAWVDGFGMIALRADRGWSIRRLFSN